MAKTRESSSPTTNKLRNGNGTHPQPTHEQIAERAYQIYLERGDAPGDEMSDWVRAEHELSAREVAERPPAEKAAKSRRKPAAKSASA